MPRDLDLHLTALTVILRGIQKSPDIPRYRKADQLLRALLTRWAHEQEGGVNVEKSASIMSMDKAAFEDERPGSLGASLLTPGALFR